MDISIIKDFLDRYIAGSATPEEQRLVEKWLDENEFSENHWNRMDAESRAILLADINFELKKTIDRNPPPEESILFSPLPWYRRLYVQLAAASVIVMAAGFSWYYITAVKKITTAAVAEKTIKNNDIRPGTNKAVLTLADGGTVVLDDSDNGVLVKQGNTEVSKKGAQLIYDANQQTNGDKVIAYNTLTTPRGGQYTLRLPDGSQVWLNAASSIRYPVVFNTQAREVEIKGEAYFEVAPQMLSGKKIPFNVRVKAMDGKEKTMIQVMGTHFNINAYDEETSVNTTLLEGKVKVSAPGASNSGNELILFPGQQAQVNVNGKGKLVYNADVEEVVAWKNGLFLMNRVDISVMLRQLSRWYDVDIVYAHGIPKGRITGDIPRNMELSEVLRIMELSGVKFKIEGKKIIVAPD